MSQKGGLPRSFDGWKRVYTNNWWTMWSQGGWNFLASTSGHGCAAILVVDTKGRFVLNHIYRLGLDKKCLEIPRGGIEAGQTPLEAAIRELREETGLSIREEDISPLGQFYPDSGILSHIAHVFLAEIPWEISELYPEDIEEVSEHKIVTHEELKSLVLSGEIKDSYTIVAERIYSLNKDNKNAGN